MSMPTGIRWRVGAGAWHNGRHGVWIEAELANGGRAQVAMVLASGVNVPMDPQARANAELVAGAREMVDELRIAVQALEYVQAAAPDTSGYAVRAQCIDSARALLGRLEPTTTEGAQA